MVSNMKKYLFGLLVLIAVSLSFSLMLTSSSEAGECARSGTSITIEDQTLSVNYLLELINKKNQGQITIRDISVE